jgi:hypothetical protein
MVTEIFSTYLKNVFFSSSKPSKIHFLNSVMEILSFFSFKKMLCIYYCCNKNYFCINFLYHLYVVAFDVLVVVVMKSSDLLSSSCWFVAWITLRP